MLARPADQPARRVVDPVDWPAERPCRVGGRVEGRQFAVAAMAGWPAGTEALKGLLLRRLLW
jgi:hypothetical protein